MELTGNCPVTERYRKHHNYVNISVPVQWLCKRQQNCFVNKGFSLLSAFCTSTHAAFMHDVYTRLANVGSATQSSSASPKHYVDIQTQASHSTPLLAVAGRR